MSQPLNQRARRVLPVAVLLLAIAVAVGGVLAARSRPAPLSSRVDAVAGTLRCPTCTAESVADSNSAMAESMRHEIKHQLSHGRSPDQIRSWFESRYGERVLLLPHPRGLALLLWVVPAAAVAGGLVFLLRNRRRRATDAAQRAITLSPRRVGVAALACVLVGAGVPALAWARTRPASSSRASAATTPMRAQDWVAVAQSLDQQQDYRAAVEAYRHAFQQQPGAEGVRTGLAFDLVRSGRPRQAIGLVAPLAQHPGPHRPLAVLILGLAQRAAGLPSATGTLRDFLRLAPHHPAAGQVRRLLSGGR